MMSLNASGILNEKNLAIVRKLLPAAAAGVATGAGVFMCGVVAFLKLAEPTLKPLISNYVTIYPPDPWDLYWIGIILGLCIWWLRRRINPVVAAVDEVTKAFDQIESATDRLNKATQNVVWRAIANELANQAKQGRLAPAAELLAIADTHAPRKERTRKTPGAAALSAPAGRRDDAATGEALPE